MKKQIALIIISMLAVMSASAQNVNENNCYNETCRIHSETPICQLGEGVIQPSLDEIFGSCDGFPGPEIKPENPESPGLPETPEIPDVPTEPEVPQEPETPETEDSVPQSSLALQVLSLVNEEREKRGLESLTYDALLSEAAQKRAVEIKTLFSHTRPDGRECFTALDEAGYRYRTAGENIAYGQKTAKEVMNAWMNSEGHRANILGENYTEIGIGVYEKGGVVYWSQFFAG